MVAGNLRGKEEMLGGVWERGHCSPVGCCVVSVSLGHAKS